MSLKNKVSYSENNLANVAAYIKFHLNDGIKDANVENGILNISTSPRLLPRVLSFLRDDPNCKFSSLTNICGIDYPEKEERFEILYHLLSHKLNQRAVVRIFTDGIKIVKSIASVYDAALWHEREVWDMFGICFAEHGDLRRIYNDFGFKGYPLRKDFPLNGEFEKSYDDDAKRFCFCEKEEKIPFKFKGLDEASKRLVKKLDLEKTKPLF